MDAKFWHARWQENKIGFHLSQVNPLLTTFWQQLDTQNIYTVFIPLCGKSMDIMWLAQHTPKVLGNELSQTALTSFAKEHALEQQGIPIKSDNITLLCKNYFDLTQQDLKDVTHIYDRASLIALPKTMRLAYVKHLMSILSQSVQILLITLDYDQNEQNGPPFAVSEQEVHQLYGQYFDIKCVDKQDKLHEWLAKGRTLSRFDESIYILSVKKT